MTEDTEKAGVSDTAPRPETEAPPQPSLREIVERIFPPPDPVNHCKREAIVRLDACDRAIRKALDLRETAQSILFEDLGRLWIHPTRSEVLLALELAELRAVVKHLSDALDLLSSARSENALRFYDERLLERGSAEARRG